MNKNSGLHHSWRGGGGEYKDIPGFCKSATLEDIRQNDYILTPGRYVGFEEVEEDDEVFEAKMEKLTKELSEQFKKSSELEKEIKKNLKSIGLDI
ncbi:MAG: N-6 DNA methylase [Candidatus Humimicrobiaceae bacterium]